MREARNRVYTVLSYAKTSQSSIDGACSLIFTFDHLVAGLRQTRNQDGAVDVGDLSRVEGGAEVLLQICW